MIIFHTSDKFSKSRSYLIKLIINLRIMNINI
jgi:hypothetical protein